MSKKTEHDKKVKKTDEDSVKKKKTKSSSSDVKKKDSKKGSKNEDKKGSRNEEKKVKKPEEEVVKKKKHKHKAKDDSKSEKTESKVPPKILEDKGSLHTVEAFKKRYQVFSKQLGKGAFSEVRLGMNRETGEEVAIKIIDKINVSENFKKNLAREIKILKGVQHDNIVCLRDMYDFEDKFLFVMELSTGGELFDRIVEKGTYSEDDAKNLIKGIVCGVEYLHSKGIVHRDLKPENLLLKSKDSDSEVKIADFGLSSFMNSETLLQTACGTPAYVAPEVLKSGGYDKAVDLWSIGVITYILLCGFPPFYADSVKDLLRIVVKAEFRFPSPYWDNISPPAKDFIKKLLTMPDNRMSATEALQHPWLKSGGSNVDLKSFREQMKNYIIKRRGERNEFIATASKK